MKKACKIMLPISVVSLIAATILFCIARIDTLNLDLSNIIKEVRGFIFEGKIINTVIMIISALIIVILAVFKSIYRRKKKSTLICDLILVLVSTFMWATVLHASLLDYLKLKDPLIYVSFAFLVISFGLLIASIITSHKKEIESKYQAKSFNTSLYVITILFIIIPLAFGFVIKGLDTINIIGGFGRDLFNYFFGFNSPWTVAHQKGVILFLFALIIQIVLFENTIRKKKNLLPSLYVFAFSIIVLGLYFKNPEYKVFFTKFQNSTNYFELTYLIFVSLSVLSFGVMTIYLLADMICAFFDPKENSQIMVTEEELKELKANVQEVLENETPIEEIEDTKDEYDRVLEEPEDEDEDEEEVETEDDDEGSEEVETEEDEEEAQEVEALEVEALEVEDEEVETEDVETEDVETEEESEDDEDEDENIDDSEDDEEDDDDYTYSPEEDEEDDEEEEEEEVSQDPEDDDDSRDLLKRRRELIKQRILAARAQAAQDEDDEDEEAEETEEVVEESIYDEEVVEESVQEEAEYDEEDEAIYEEDEDETVYEEEIEESVEETEYDEESEYDDEESSEFDDDADDAIEDEEDDEEELRAEEVARKKLALIRQLAREAKARKEQEASTEDTDEAEYDEEEYDDEEYEDEDEEVLDVESDDSEYEEDLDVDSEYDDEDDEEEDEEDEDDEEDESPSKRNNLDQQAFDEDGNAIEHKRELILSKLASIQTKPFNERILSLEDEKLERYNIVRNELESYKKVHERLSKKADSFRFGRELIAKITIVGKTIRLHLALNPDNYQDSKYSYQDLSNKSKYVMVPMTLKLRSGRSVKYAIELIGDLAFTYGLEKNPKYVEQDFTDEFRSMGENE